jgi:hypothetical protein
MRAFAFVLLIFSRAVIGADADVDPYREWLAFKEDAVRMASGPTGMYAIQDMSVLAPGDMVQLQGSKPAAARWTRVANANAFLTVRYESEKVVLEGEGVGSRDLLGEKERRFRLPNGLSVAVTPLERSSMKLWLYNPALPAQRRFQSLAYFAYDERGVVAAKFTPNPTPSGITHVDSRNHSGLMYWIGDVEFTFAGRAQRMRAFNKQKEWAKIDHLLLLVRDRTSGKTTYGGGRVLEVQFAAGAPPQSLTLNFNTLYSFLCAHSDFYNCPIALTDRIDAELTFGEKHPPVLGSDGERESVQSRNAPIAEQRGQIYLRDSEG